LKEGNDNNGLRREEFSFDDVAMGLADGTLTRGQALKYMSAALLGGLGAMAGISAAAGDADARRKKGKHKRKRHTKHATPACLATCTSGCCVGNDCKAGNTTQFCGTGGGACVTCASGQICSAGKCVAPPGPPPPPASTCTGGCTPNATPGNATCCSNGLCTQNCPGSAPFKLGFNSPQCVCVAQCPAGTTPGGGFCACDPPTCLATGGVCTLDFNSCVKTCPAGQCGLTSTGVCVNTCPAPSICDPATNRCAINGVPVEK
jgi:hypothetical protein